MRSLSERAPPIENQHNNVSMSVSNNPDFRAGIQYWCNQPASLDGVLGGFGSGSLPRVDALGSRQFLQLLLPELCTLPSAIRPLKTTSNSHRFRALDVGAGIGRTTQTVLLQLFSDVFLVEPVPKFVQTAYQNCLENMSSDIPSKRWKGIMNKTNSVTFIEESLQTFTPLSPFSTATNIKRLGYDGETESVFDIIWCQWCLGHLSDPDLIDFFKRAKESLRSPSKSFIVVKENLYQDAPGDLPQVAFDEQDSSLTRSNAAWIRCFREAGLTVVHERIQQGFPIELYAVKMYALQPAAL